MSLTTAVLVQHRYVNMVQYTIERSAARFGVQYLTTTWSVSEG